MVDGPLLRVAFFGTPQFAVPTLDALLASRHTVVGVVTQPDRPRGRGHKTSDAPVKARARAADLPVFQPERLKDAAFLDALRALHADIGVVAAYGKILPAPVLATPELGMINVHASLLPKYRGAAPVHRAIIAGEIETGVTIMRVVQALDAGPMLATVSRAIGPDETSDEVERSLAGLGATLLAETLDAIAAGRATETAQDDSRATYAARLAKDDGRVDWSRSATAIHDLIRGLQPWPHAYAQLAGQRIILLRSTPIGTEASAAPGTVVEASRSGLGVATGSGVIRLDELQMEGRRPMAAAQFLAGHRLHEGDRFDPTP
jgi:methionyl-tRNA formyltransferase